MSDLSSRLRALEKRHAASEIGEMYAVFHNGERQAVDLVRAIDLCLERHAEISHFELSERSQLAPIYGLLNVMLISPDE